MLPSELGNTMPLAGIVPPAMIKLVAISSIDLLGAVSGDACVRRAGERRELGGRT